MKKCTVCKESKPFIDYYNYKASKDGKAYRCKTCDSIARKAWSDNNPQRQRESLRGRHLKHKYGITLKDYEKLLDSQKGMCAICGCTSEDNKKVKGSFAVDHCHTTGEVRGLLCNQCNRAIGMLGDDPSLLTKAVEYLQKSGDSLMEQSISDLIKDVLRGMAYDRGHYAGLEEVELIYQDLLHSFRDVFYFVGKLETSSKQNDTQGVK